jgi:hypothetical protein
VFAVWTERPAVQAFFLFQTVNNAIQKTSDANPENKNKK